MYQEVQLPALTPLVHSVWYADSADIGIPYSVTPEVGANLVIKLRPTDAETILSGPVTERKMYPFIPNVEYFGIRFQPGVSKLFQTLALKEVPNESIDIVELLGLNWQMLAEQLHGQKREQRLLYLQMMMQKMLAKSQSINPIIQFAIQHIQSQCGQIIVSKLAYQHQISERHLERLFADEVGLSPKAFAKVIRLQHVLSSIWQKPALTMSDLAFRCGYSDQAHLAHDFKQMMGLSISGYLNEQDNLQHKTTNCAVE